MIANHKGEVPFLILIIPYLAGICIGNSFLSAAYTIPLSRCSLFFGLVFIALNITYKRFNIYKLSWLGGLLLTVMLFLFGTVSVLRYNELNKAGHFSRSAAQYQVAKISNEPLLKNGYLRFKAKVEENISNHQITPASGTLLISLKDTSARSLNYGDELLIPANYKAVDPPFNPAEFNYKQYLANQNIHYQTFLYPGQYVVLAQDAGSPLIAYALGLRQRLVAKLKINMRDPQAVAVASTLLLGYKADLSSDVLQAYAKTGTVYVLSVSGAQVAIIYGLLSLALGFLNRFKHGKVLKAIIIISLISYYALLTGFSPSVCRAALMVSLVILGKTYNRYINTLNLLAASAFILLLYDPLYIADVGFQFSYIAITGLVIFRPAVYQWFKFKNRWAEQVWSLCSVSIAAQVVTFPLSALYFHQFPVYFLVSNLLVAIPATVITVTGLIYLLLPHIPFVSAGLGFILEKTILLMNKILTLTANMPFAGINKIWINTTEYLLLYGIMISLFYFLYDRKVWLLKLSLIGILLLCINISVKKIGAIRSNSIAFLNIGKHSGIVLKRGTSAIVLTDLADTDKNYKYSIQPYLDSIGTANVMVCGLNRDTLSAYVLKKYNYVQFLDKSIVIANKQYGKLNLAGPLLTDYVYVIGNPGIDIKSIHKNYNSRLMVIDGTNSNAYISRVQKQAEAMHLKYAVLKRNNSLVLVSN